MGLAASRWPLFPRHFAIGREPVPVFPKAAGYGGAQLATGVCWRREKAIVRRSRTLGLAWRVKRPSGN